jgi:hypothetical protein
MHDTTLDPCVQKCLLYLQALTLWESLGRAYSRSSGSRRQRLQALWIRSHDRLERRAWFNHA